MQEHGLLISKLAASIESEPWIIDFFRHSLDGVDLPSSALEEALAHPERGSEMFEWIRRSFDGQIPLNIKWAAARSGLVLLECKEEGKLVSSPEDNVGTLYNAAKFGVEQHLIQLLAEDVPPDIVDGCGNPPLWVAAIQGHTRIVQRLLETGKVNIEKTDALWDRTVLFWAAALDHEEVVQTLLENGAKQEITDRDGYTPMQIARRWKAYRSIDVMKKFERREDRIVSDGEAPEEHNLNKKAQEEEDLKREKRQRE